MTSVSNVLDYPSQHNGLAYPPAPMLLDTCLIQHLEFVMDILGEAFIWPANAERWIRRRYGPELGEDLIALGDIVAFLFPRQGPPWAVSETSWDELSKIGGTKGSRLRGWWSDWAGCWEGWIEQFPDIDADALWPNDTAADPSQLQLFESPAPVRHLDLATDGSYGPFTDNGDRALIRDAIRSNVLAILTTDVRSFWAHRSWLYQAGIEVWRPRDLWVAIDPRVARSTVA